jgi:hypothetical protein
VTTRCYLDPQVRRDRAWRRAMTDTMFATVGLLRKDGKLEKAMEVALIAKALHAIKTNTSLPGDVKQHIFLRTVPA